MEDDLRKWQDASIRLWQQLEAIDKADHACTDANLFRLVVRRIILNRHAVLVSDGVTVDFPSPEKE